MASDAELLRRIKAGDREALAQWYGRYLPVLWRYVYARLRGDEPASRDLTSEIFLTAIRALLDDRPAIENAGAWLTGIARHKLADHFRRRRRDAGENDGAAQRQSNDDPAAAMEISETRRLVGRVMQRLDDEDRTILEWKYIDGLSIGEIAGRLGRGVKAIEAAMYRARKAFRSIYNAMQNCGEPHE